MAKIRIVKEVSRGRWKWQGLLASAIVGLALGSPVNIDISAALLQAVEARYGKPARERVDGWGKLMRADRAAADLSDEQKMVHANDYFNQVEWLTDLEHWGQEDYWATPVETLATNGGDCEDFSIGKYFSLLETQIDPEKLRITYVKSLTYNQAHMVLVYYPTPDAEPLVLDNINKTILPASQRKDLVPVYSFSGESIWLARERGRKLNANSMVSLPQWKSVNERFLKEMRKARE